MRHRPFRRPFSLGAVMRRLLCKLTAILEIILAALLVGVCYQLPDAKSIEKNFGGAQRVAERSADQLRLLRQQVDDLRRPEMLDLVDRLQKQTRLVTSHLRSQAVDFDSIRTLRDALGEVAKGLDALAKT